MYRARRFHPAFGCVRALKLYTATSQANYGTMFTSRAIAVAVTASALHLLPDEPETIQQINLPFTLQTSSKPWPKTTMGRYTQTPIA